MHGTIGKIRTIACEALNVSADTIAKMGDYEKEMEQDALLNEATNEIKIVWRAIDDKMILYFYCAIKGRKTSLFPQQSVVSFEMDTKHELVSGEIGCGFSYLYQSTMGICRKLKQRKIK